MSVQPKLTQHERLDRLTEALRADFTGGPGPETIEPDIAQRMIEAELHRQQDATRAPTRMGLKEEADEIIYKSLAVSKCLQYAKQTIQDDDGETIDGITWVLNDNLRRLQQIVAELENSP